MPEASAARLAPRAGPALADAARWLAGDGGESFLRRHHGGEAAPDLAAWLQSLGAGQPPLANAAISPAAIDRGEKLWGERACQACHVQASLEGLAARTDHAHVMAFLVSPAAHRPGVVHDFGLATAEATALAAWLLRGQWSKETTAAVPGFAYECFELQVDKPALPDLEGLVAKARGLATTIDAKVGTREDHFALRFTAMLQVPATGEWKFTCGSDDSSALWIDEQQVVKNENIGPHRRRSGTVHLEQGPHTLRVLFTEAAGGQSLEVLWKGPGVAEQPIPASSASATSRALVPPPPRPAPAAEAVARGRQQAHGRRCASCHTIEDAELAALPKAALARPFVGLGAGACPQVPGAAAIHAAAAGALGKPRDVAVELRGALLRDGCLSCHAREGRGGLPPVARRGLVEVEDLGDEGRLPPDLTAVGHRLRASWIEKVLAEGHQARPYLKVRMPKLPAEAAKHYAELFAAVDGRPGDDDEPPFSLEQATLGQQLVGTGGKNCVTCHTFAGLRALGPQGMDLGAQYARVRPAHFRDWLLHAATLRPGTRMPTLWVLDNEADHREVDAVRSWLSLGAAAPLPAGLVLGGRGLVLEPVDRPKLHGAFLKGLSARCIAIGSPLRTHYAYDVAHARLAWLWRGAFLDAEGTWSGRAGQLVEPLGEDWLVLDDVEFANGAPRAVVAQRVTAAGYPAFRVTAGEAEFEDLSQPRLVQGGSELVRTLQCARGPLVIDLVAQKRGKVKLLVAGAAALDRYTLQAGESLEVVYQW